MLERLPLFVLATFVVLAVPGPDFVLVTRNCLVAGRRGGYRTALGICAGLTSLTALTACGVTAVVTANPAMLTVLRIAGGGYLIVLALLLFRSARHRCHSRPPGAADHDSKMASRSPIAQGFLNNVLNPKALIFFLTFVPQFIGAGASVFAQTAVLGLVVVCCAATWWAVYIVALDTMSVLLQRRTVLVVIDVGGGLALGALGTVVTIGTV